MSSLISLICLLSCLLTATASSEGQYMTYLTSWGPKPVDQIKTMIHKGVIQPNMMIAVAFASYNWDPSHPDNIPGLENINSTALKQIADLIHQAGGKVCLSIGGANAAYNYYGSALYGQTWQIATYINQAIQQYHFDGIDFDVEAQASLM